MSTNDLTSMPDPVDYCYGNSPYTGRKPDRASAIFTADQMQAYARAAVEAEREACANLCEDRAGTASMFATVAEARSHGATVRGCAAAIRARGKS